MSKLQSEPNLTRRRIIKSSGIIGAIALISPLSLMAAPYNNREIFLSISKALTSNDNLNSELSVRIHQALKDSEQNFDRRLNTLSSEMSKKSLEKNYDLTPSSQSLAKLIISAWYTGIVGSGTKARVITYRHALQFEAVKDVLQIRSYCPNRPGFWAAKPEVNA
ncbi:sorbitol dehydrogenase family protein [Vibrio sp.]|nr:sorbitol dehydrogenase family protein [Vibrio sp.]